MSSVGNSGGLAFLWRKNILVDLVSYSKNHIDALMKVYEDRVEIRITGIYGEPNFRNQHITWSLLHQLHAIKSKPWFIGGDFNEILSSREKECGQIRGPNLMTAFNAALVDCGLSDMGYEGCHFIWSSNRLATRTVRCLLDRV